MIVTVLVLKLNKKMLCGENQFSLFEEFYKGAHCDTRQLDPI